MYHEHPDINNTIDPAALPHYDDIEGCDIEDDEPARVRSGVTIESFPSPENMPYGPTYDDIRMSIINKIGGGDPEEIQRQINAYFYKKELRDTMIGGWAASFNELPAQVKGEDMVLLLQISSTDRFEIYDDGLIQFFIKRDDLRRDFSNVIHNNDSH